MVIVIDLEEEEAKKAAEAAAATKQTATTTSPNSSGSGEPGGDKNGKSGKKSQSVPKGSQNSKGKPDAAGGEGAAAGVAEPSPTQKSCGPDSKKKEDTVKDSKSKPQQTKSMPSETNPSKGRDGKAGKVSKCETTKVPPSVDKASPGAKSELAGASVSKEKVADGSKTNSQPAKGSTDSTSGSKGKQQQVKSSDAEKTSSKETTKVPPSVDKASPGAKSELAGSSVSKEKVADGSKTNSQPAKGSTDSTSGSKGKQQQAKSSDAEKTSSKETSKVPPSVDKASPEAKSELAGASVSKEKVADGSKTNSQPAKGSASGSKGKQQQAKGSDAEKVSSKGKDATSSKEKPKSSLETDKTAAKGNDTNPKNAKSSPQQSKFAGTDKPTSKSKETVQSKPKSPSTDKATSKGTEVNAQSQASNVASPTKAKDSTVKKGKEESPTSPPKSSSKGKQNSSSKTLDQVIPPESSSNGHEKSSAKAPNQFSPTQESSSTEGQKDELPVTPSQQKSPEPAAESAPPSKNPVTVETKSEEQQQPLGTTGQKLPELAESKVETPDDSDSQNAVAETKDPKSAASENPQVTKKPKSSYSSFSSSLMTPTLTTLVKAVRERLSRNGQLDKILESFKTCKTDEERVACLYNIEDVHEVLNVKETYKAKNEDEAKDLRIQGNLAFQKKDYDAALKLYSDCIIYAPSKGSTELALALGNRSAVLYHLHNYVLCLQDIRQAFKHGYPDHLQYKLYERRGKASYALRLKEEAICSFNDSLNVLDKTQLDQKKVATLKSDLMKQLEKCNKIVPGGKFKNVRDYNHNHTQIPVLKERQSSHIPCMVNSLVMKSTDGHGRGLYATRDIEVGELLIVEKPFASVTLREHNLTHCHHCCNRVYCPLPCTQCSGVVFCSEECLDTAMKSYHYAECKYHDLIQRSELGMAHLALRMVLKVGHKSLREYQKKAEKKTSDPLLLGCNEAGVYDSDDYNTVYNLVNHTNDRSCPDLFRRALGAVFLLKCIEKSEFFAAAECAEDSDVDEEMVYVGGHILRHIQMLPCNAHEVSELLYKTYRVEMSEPVEIGSAIYSTLSLINHSCDPSVIRHSYGNQCVVRAIRNIAKGAEIVDNYGVLYAVTGKQMRQEKLSAQYYFNCNCYACACNWPMYNKIRSEDPVLKCKKCKAGRVRIPPDNHTTRAICSDCREVMDITPDLLHLSKSEQFFQGSLDKVLKGEERDAALPFLVDHLKLVDTVLFLPWKDYNDCQEAIKQCYASMGNCHVVEEPDEDDEELMMGERRNFRPT